MVSSLVIVAMGAARFVAVVAMVAVRTDVTIVVGTGGSRATARSAVTIKNAASVAVGMDVSGGFTVMYMHGYSGRMSRSARAMEHMYYTGNCNPTFKKA